MIIKSNEKRHFIKKLYTLSKNTTLKNVNCINHLYAFIVGLCIGSFINVVVYRLPNDLSIITKKFLSKV